MRSALLLVPIAVLACAEGNRENNPVCGFASMAGALMALEQFRAPGKVLQEVPSDLEGVVPARVVGWGTARALAAAGPDGLILGYEGEGFPPVPGFGLILVEDSLDTFKGVLIYEKEPPRGYTQLGTISSATMTLPLYGLRVTWSTVSSERCPLLAPIDTAAR